MRSGVEIVRVGMFMLCSSTLQEQGSEGLSYGA